jgi:hypothetical protein
MSGRFAIKFDEDLLAGIGGFDMNPAHRRVKEFFHIEVRAVVAAIGAVRPDSVRRILVSRDASGVHRTSEHRGDKTILGYSAITSISRASAWYERAPVVRTCPTTRMPRTPLTLPEKVKTCSEHAGLSYG